MGKMSAGSSHKTPYFTARDTVANTHARQQEYTPGTRVVVHSMGEVPNPYDGRLGEVVGSNEVEGQTAYTVLLDVYLPREPAGTPMEFFADELRPVGWLRDLRGL